MRKTINTLSFLFVAAGCASVTAGPPETAHGTVSTVPADTSLGARIHELVTRTVPFGFSGQVVVERGGVVLLDEAYGYADAWSGRAMTGETPVGIASVSKQFAAAAVMVLVEEGRLSLDDTLPQFFDSVPASHAGITVAQLLTHTSGVRTSLREDFEARSLNELVRSLTTTPLAFEPGSRWSYSTEGYNLVAAIVQIVSGVSYGAFLRDRLFGPAGLEHTHLQGESIGAEARAYLAWDDRGAPVDWPRNWRNFGAGDVFSTARDLRRWDVALREGRVVRPESFAAMMTSHAEVQPGVGYGYGFFVHEPAGEPRMIEHGGDAELGYNASYYRYPDEEVMVFITSNRRTPDGVSLRHALGRPIEQLFRGESAAAPPTAYLLDGTRARAMAGTYRLGDDARFHVVYDGVHTWLIADGQAAVDLLTGSDSLADERILAGRRTHELLTSLREGRVEAGYTAALDTAASRLLGDYRDEWTVLVTSKGPLQAFRVEGAVTGSGIALVRARLRFRDGTSTMSFFWSDFGRGRLRGTNVEAAAIRPPYALPIAQAPDGSFVAYDPIGAVTMRFTRGSGGELVLRDPFDAAMTAIPIGPAGWIPPFRP